MVQRRFVLVLILLSVLTLIGCGGSSDSSTSAPTVSVIKTNATFDLTDVAVSPSGTIYAATYLPSFGGPSVLRSVDQGQTWQELTTGLKPPFHRILAIDDNNLVAATNAIYRSTDRAATWSILAFDEFDSGGVHDLHFLDANRVVLVKAGWLYHSDDGGRTWQEAYSSNANCDTFSFPDQLTGYCSGGSVWDNVNAGVVMKTVDGGKSWIDLGLYASSRMAAVTGMQFLSPSTGFIFTFNREMFKTTDGGTTWTLVSSNVPEPYERPFFVDEHLGVVVSGGGNGTIYQTNDGGRTWRKIFDTPSGISSLRKVNRTTALFVGKGGLLGRITLNS